MDRGPLGARGLNMDTMDTDLLTGAILTLVVGLAAFMGGVGAGWI